LFTLLSITLRNSQGVIFQVLSRCHCFTFNRGTDLFLQRVFSL